MGLSLRVGRRGKTDGWRDFSRMPLPPFRFARGGLPGRAVAATRRPTWRWLDGRVASSWSSPRALELEQGAFSDGALSQPVPRMPFLVCRDGRYVAPVAQGIAQGRQSAACGSIEPAEASTVDLRRCRACATVPTPRRTLPAESSTFYSCIGEAS